MSSLPRGLKAEWRKYLSRHGFDVERRIGSGAYGSVYSAAQPNLGRRVAVKFFSGTFMRDEASKKRFERESQLLARIDHPSIPYVVTRGTVADDGTPYMVMQLIDGETLAAKIEREDVIPVERSVAYVLAVLNALSAAHDVGVVHRDVKPDNIVVGPHGPVLIDFSVGVCLDYSPGLSRATRRGEAVGDLRYASPEQRADAANVDARTDIYSVGIVLLECLTGYPKLNVVRLNGVLTGPSAPLIDVIKKACADDRTVRYQTAAEFAGALAPFGPRIVPIPFDGVALCPKPGCPSGFYSDTGYFRGPAVIVGKSDPHCESCGSALLRACTACGHALSANLGDLVVTQTRSSPDRLTAHCPMCGTAVFTTPTCDKCGSLLKAEDMDIDSSEHGCGKCRRPQAPPTSYSGGASGPDDDIPF